MLFPIKKNKVFTDNIFSLKLILFLCYLITTVEEIFFYYDYSKFFELNNGNFLILTENAIYIYDSKLENKISELVTGFQIETKEDFNFVTFAQYSKEEGGDIIILYKDFIYYFYQENSRYIECQINLETGGLYYTLVPYKIVDKLFFIVGFIDKETKLAINIYEIDVEQNIIILKLSNIPKFQTYSGETSSQTYNGFSCQMMKSQTYGKVLTCFYVIENYLGISSFNIENSLSIIPEISNLNFKDRLPGYIFSKLSFDKSRALICYISNENVFCNKYDIDKHQLSEEIKYLDSCYMELSNINLFYSKNSEEYILSCYDSSFNFSFVKFDKEMNLIYFDKEKNNFQYKFSLEYKCYKLEFYSIIFYNNKEYLLMVDSGCYVYYGYKEGTTSFILSEEFNPIKDIYPQTDLISYTIYTSQISDLDSLSSLFLINKSNSILSSSIFTNETQNNRYYYDDNSKKIINLEINEPCPEKFLYENKDSKECVQKCNYEEFIYNKCFINNLTDNNIENITQDIRNILNKTKNDSNLNIVIEGANSAYQIISSNNMNENINNNLSILNLKNCENILKKIYKIDYILVLKIDTIISNSPNIINYELYNPYNLEKLNLSYCENIFINIYSTYNPSESSLNKIIKLKEYGYDLFDLNNSFYQDLCTPFTSDDGTDIILSDRLIDYYENISLCEKNCRYKNYDLKAKKVLCDCPIKKQINLKIENHKDYFLYFINIRNFSNIKVLKCFKLVFSKLGQMNNIGSYIFIFIIFIYTINFIIYEIKQKERIARIIRMVIENKYYNNNELNIQVPPIKKASKYESSISVFDLSKMRKSFKKKNNVHFKNENNFKFSAKGTNLSKNNKKKALRSSMRQISNNKKSPIFPHQEKSSALLLKRISQSTKIIEFVKKKKSKLKDSIKSSNYNLYMFNDEELNSLVYEDAIIFDNRKYFKYYYSLIKLKHLIFFTFVLKNDYNLFIIKLSLFLFSFSLYFTINIIFFVEINIHELYQGKGKIKFLSKLPYIIYSTVISTLISYIIKRLALSHKDMLKIKKIEKKEEAIRESVILIEKLKVRFRFFFIVSYLFLNFFWYFMASFCAVYKNTQKTLIDNTLISFILSLLYPFGINLIPGFFRLPALKSKKSKCMYKFSQILELL